MKKLLKFLSVSFTFCCIFLVAIALYIAGNYSKGLPDHKQLKMYNPAITTRLYSVDGLLLKEYAKEKRLFVPIEQIPDLVKNAFISAEDANFYIHPGVDFKALIKAAVYDVGAFFTGSPIRGASTITQQVAKNFLLTKDKTFERKIKEAILAFRMTKAFTKDEILELYLNQIYLGNRSYGVASASLNYFDKSLDELTIEEVAMLAALPKAPGKIDPVKNYDRAMERRNWVIKRMNQEKYISDEEAKLAMSRDIVIKGRNQTEIAQAEHFAEEVRKQLVEMYGEESLLTEGKVVTTTLNPRLQQIADKALKAGIEAYDMKHGWRGALGNISARNRDFDKNWPQSLLDFKIEAEYNPNWVKAVILDIDDEKERVKIGLEPVKTEDIKTPEEIDAINVRIANSDNFLFLRDEGLVLKTGYIDLKDLEWARTFIDVDTIGQEIKKPSYTKLKRGDVVLAEQLDSVLVEEKGKDGAVVQKAEEKYALKQIPDVNGAVIIMDPHNGRILAMMGGYLDSAITFNRATQADRQPGSVLKTFGYLAAMENGFTPASIIMDEPITLDQGLGRPPYTPKNYSEQFYGPTTLRVGLEKSRNVATVRMASEVGLDKITEVIRRFGINEHPTKIYSIVLGSTETNLIKLTNAYAMIVNGGKIIQPALIERIQDKNGNTIYRRDARKCVDCAIIKDEEESEALKDDIKKVEKFGASEIIFPQIPDMRLEITDSATAYQITSMLEGVIKRGTGWKAKAVGKTLGGKTGTTNDIYDAWFVGFSPDLVVGVYVGFDEPRTLGEGESGSSVASPIFTNIMMEALKDSPSIPFRVPPTIKLVKIDHNTGYYPTTVTNPADVIYEAFRIEDRVTKNVTQFDKEVEEMNEEYVDGAEDEEILEIKKNRMEERNNEEMMEDIESGMY